MAVFFIQTGNGRVEQRGDLLPRFVFRLLQKRLHMCLLFTFCAAILDLQGIGGGKTGRAMQPTGNDCVRPQRTRLARENDEHGLGHLFGQMRVAHLPHGRRIDQVDMAGHERCKRLFGLAGDIIPHECHVVVDHSPNTWTPDRKGNSLFFDKTELQEGYEPVGMRNGMPPALRRLARLFSAFLRRMKGSYNCDKQE